MWITSDRILLCFCLLCSAVMQSVGKFDMKEPYYRQLTTWAAQMQAAVPAQQQQQQQPQFVMSNLVLPAQQHHHPATGFATDAGVGAHTGGQQPQQQWTGSGIV